MKEDVEKARIIMESGNLDLITQRSVYLQDALYRRLEVLCSQWNMAIVPGEGTQKFNNSAVLRVLLELMMPFLMVIDDVSNEEELLDQLRGMFCEYFVDND